MLMANPYGPHFHIDSAGTGSWHVGEPPYGPMQRAARLRGIDMSDLRARQVTQNDFCDFDVIIAMDRDNLASLRKSCPPALAHKIAFMGDFATAPYRGQDVPDPYYTRDFDATLDMLENAITGLVTHLQTQID
jgi:protein-tyrosine phosphatase